MTKSSLPFRTHYFSLAVSKFVFLHPTHGVVFVRDPIRCSEARKYKLSPVLLYAISISGTAIRRISFALANQPHGIYATLHRLWSLEAKSFRGIPDAVLVSRQVAAASPTLAGLLAKDGVELILAEKGDKVSAAELRTAQQSAMHVGWSSGSKRRINSLDQLDEEAAARHRFDLKYHREKHRQLHEEWAALPLRPVPEMSCGDPMDWSPGPWLSSWEVSLPPVSKPRYFYNDDSKDKTMWLLTGSAADRYEDDREEEEEESDEDEDWADEDEPIPVEMAKDMVACWPNSISDVARSIGTSARDLKWFLDGKAGLNDGAISELLSVLGIESGEYGYEAEGPCVLVARDGRAAMSAYDHLSHGDDVGACCEVIPENGQADPSWRYLLFQRSYGGTLNVMMFERGSKAAERLNAEFFGDLEGLRKVSGKLYRDVVSTYARASLSPEANRREMLGFEQRQADALEEIQA